MADDDRTPRSYETRAKQERRKPWQPPSSLDAPPPPEGYVHKWIRESYANIDDRKTVSARLREGFDLVRAEEYPDYDFPTIQEGRNAGVIGVGGLLLARMPIETRQEREQYYRGRSSSQMKAVDEDLMREQHPVMPIHNDRRTQVSFGGPGENTSDSGSSSG